MAHLQGLCNNFPEVKNFSQWHFLNSAAMVVVFAYESPQKELSYYALYFGTKLSCSAHKSARLLFFF
jgi:hypothetical protein